MKVLFVYSEIQVKFGAYGFQHGVAALSAYLKQNGYTEVSLFYASQLKELKCFQSVLQDQQPDLVAFYVTHDQDRFVQRMVREARAAGCYTICGGPHATLSPEMVESRDGPDAVCIGEGERPLLQLVRAREQGDDPARIPGLWTRHSSGVVTRADPGPLLQNLDELPFVDRELFEQHLPGKGVGLTQIGYRNSIRISRGCPFGCTFCSNRDLSSKQSGTFLRFRSLEHVIREIEAVVKKFVPAEIYFEDDTFTLVETYIDEFCEAYRERVGLPFEFFSRISPSTPGILRKLRDAGGRRVSFGIESGNEPLRRQVLKKRFSNADVIRVFREGRRIGYQLEAFVMVGMPGETPEKFRDTVNLLRAIQPDLYSLSIYFPFKGTQLYRECVEQGYVDPAFELPEHFVSRRDSVLNMPGFPRRDILRAVRRFGWDVYRGRSWRKAVLFLAYESGPGDLLLRLLAPFRRHLRRFVMPEVHCEPVNLDSLPPHE